MEEEEPLQDNRSVTELDPGERTMFILLVVLAFVIGALSPHLGALAGP